MYTCENCGCIHSGEYGQSLKYKPKNNASIFRFCSAKCAHSYSTKNNRELINNKVSETLKRRFQSIEKVPKAPKAPKQPIVTQPKQKKQRQIITKHCIYCNKEFELRKYNKRWCSVECSIESKKAQRLLDVEQSGYHKNYRMVKRYLLHKHGNVCSICGFSGLWNGKPVIMIADHINGRSSDNRVSNMRLVCPMCDTQLDTFKSKNKNSDRVNRKGMY